MAAHFYVQWLFPALSAEELNEQTFALTYLFKGGLNYDNVMQMTRQERDWFLSRIAKQKREESRQIQQAKGNAK